MEKVIAVIDLKSFYASVECVLRGLDPLKALLVVCDESRGEGTLVLSASPELKRLYGVKNVSRKLNIPKIEGLIYATPRMETYVRVSADVVSIFLDYVGEDDLHVYSIDEAFLNLGPYLKLYKCSAKTLVKKIINSIHEKLGLYATAGIGPNMLLAKCALDNDAKKAKDFIAEWDEKDIKTKLWNLKPLSKMWGISHGYELKLNQLGIFDVRTLANYPKEELIQRFGVMGEELWEHANGRDESDIRNKYVPNNTSLSNGQVMHRDYNKDEMRLIIKEMNDDLCLRLRLENKRAKQVSLGIMYSSENHGGFSHQLALQEATNDENKLLDGLMKIYNCYIEDYPIRKIFLSFGKLSNTPYEQIDLFIGAEEQEKRHSLSNTLDQIKFRYGKNSVLRMSSLDKSSTAKERHNQIGGHKK